MGERARPDPARARRNSMHAYARIFGLLAAVMPLGASAQTPPAIEGPVYVATYVEVLPNAVRDGAALLRQYREALRNQAGNVRSEVVQETGRTTRFVVLAVWSDQKVFDAHGKNASTAQLREKFKTLLAAPFDERLHS